MDTIVGGAGRDTVDFSLDAASGGSFGAVVDLLQNLDRDGFNNLETLSGIENAIGTQFRDILSGDGGANVLSGLAEADRLAGGGGNDTLIGGDGDDIFGGGRSDGGPDDDLIDGGVGIDLLNVGTQIGEDVFVDLEAGVASSVVTGNDTLVSIEQVTTNAGDDILLGNAADNLMFAGFGTDRLDGRGGNDQLLGYIGIDILIGGAGDDQIDGGTDTDTAVYSGNRADYAITQNAIDSLSLVDLRAGSPDGSDTVTAVELFAFSDGTLTEAALLNQGPTITSDGAGDAASISVIENGTTVTTVTASDPDLGQTLAFGIIGGADASLFMIDSTTGILAFASGPDFELPGDAGADNTYDVTVQVSDGNGGIDTQTISVAVSNLNEAPTDITLSAATITENAANGTLIGLLTATDPDHGGALTFSLVDNAADRFAIADGNRLVVSNGALLDFEEAGSHTIRVRVIDAGGLTREEDLTIALHNVAGITLAGNNNANTLAGTGEEDTLNGQGGNDVLSGLGGNDTLIGGAGADTLNGGTGNDTFTYSLGNGADVVDGGGDLDTLRITGILGNDTLDVLFDGAALTKFEGGTVTSVEAVTADLLGGTNTLSYAETGATVSVLVILANATASGFSSIANIANVTGGNGADVLIGGNGANVLNGGAGDDVLIGGLGNDALSGGGGIDTASFTTETDAMFVDLVAGTARRGSAAALVEDTLATIEYVIGGSGDDDFRGNGGANSIEGGTGKDTLVGLGGADTLFGGLGDDTLVGGAGNDTMSGGDGDDAFTYAFGDGADAVDGGLGNDALNVTGIAANDTLNVIFDGASLTNFEGGTVVGVETVQADLLSGTDTLTYAGTTATVIVDLATGAASGFTSIAGIENVVGGSGNDILTGGAGTNTLAGGAGNDTFVVNDATDVVSEANGVTGGVDTINSLSNAYALTDADVENLTFIGEGNFTGTGNGSDNVITGGSGSNVLNGNGGKDTLIGGEADDVMNGGAGNDTFVFAPGFGNDTISQFDANPTGGQDLLDLTGLGIDAGNFDARVDILDLGSDTLVIVDGTNTILLTGVNGTGSNLITQSDFWLL